MTVLADSAESGRQRPHFLHVFPSFGIGGIPLRMVRVINHFGGALRHTVVALDDNFAAAQHLAANLEVSLLARGRARRGLLAALLDGSAVLRRVRPDLLITYNWGAIEWAMADRLWGGARQMHFEAGFGEEEADRQIPRIEAGVHLERLNAYRDMLQLGYKLERSALAMHRNHDPAYNRPETYVLDDWR